MPFPSERLAEFEKDIRLTVDALRAEGVDDEKIAHILFVRPMGKARHMRGTRSAFDGALRKKLPDLVDDYAKPVKPGHVTVVIVAPEGNGVFHVKVAR